MILGGTGHIGSALAQTLLDRDEPVLVVTHDAGKQSDWEHRGAEVAVVDVADADALREVFRRGTRAFLLNPPADPSGDTDAEERRTVRAILDALDGSGLELVVAESTYGAQPGVGVGDLGVLYEFERGLLAQPIPAAIMRGAYYFTNWDAQLAATRDEGVIHTPLPEDFAMPMVDPADIGRFAAGLMTGPAESSGPHHVEGPERYTSADVAAAFADALGRDVSVAVTPHEALEESFRQVGFSDAAAASYAGMTRATLDGDFPDPVQVEHGETTLSAYVQRLVSTTEDAP